MTDVEQLKSLKNQLTNLEENQLPIEERESEHVLTVDIPFPLIMVAHPLIL